MHENASSWNQLSSHNVHPPWRVFFFQVFCHFIYKETPFIFGIFPVFFKAKATFSESSKEQKITRISACNNGQRLFVLHPLRVLERKRSL